MMGVAKEMGGVNCNGHQRHSKSGDMTVTWILSHIIYIRNDRRCHGNNAENMQPSLESSQGIGENTGQAEK